MSERNSTVILTERSKRFKIDRLSVSIVLITILVVCSAIFANPMNSNGKKGIQPRATSCAIRLLILIDRSSSISVGHYGGSSGNVSAIKSAISSSNGLVEAASGPHSQMKVVAFADYAVSITGWLPASNNSQKSAIKSSVNSIVFKNSHTTSSYGGHPDREGRTNWHGGFVEAYIANPTHVIIFTDGVPTTHLGDTNLNLVQDPPDRSNAIAWANELKKTAIVYAVGVGSGVNAGNLQEVASGASRVYHTSNYGGLESRFRSAVSNMNAGCTPVPTTGTGPTTPTSPTSPTTPTTPTTTVPPIPVYPSLVLTANPPSATVLEGQDQMIDFTITNTTSNAALHGVSLFIQPGSTCTSYSSPIGGPFFLNPGASTNISHNISVDLGAPNPLTFTACAIGYPHILPGFIAASPYAWDTESITINVERVPLPT